MKRDNQNLVESLKKLQDEKHRLEARIKDLEGAVRNYEEKIVPTLHDRLKTDAKFHIPGDGSKKINVELDTNKVIPCLPTL